MSDTNLTDWLTFAPAGEVRKRKAYIDLPAFSYAAQGSAGEASVIVAQFNFSASKDFYLLTRPTKPTGVNYGLCIRWRVGETVYRYKLWEDASFNLTDVVALYNKERIRANFVLEVWNFPGTASSQVAAIRMVTSVRSAPTDFRSIVDYALAVGAEFTNLANTNTYSMPSGLTSRWKADDVATGAVSSWVDSVNSLPLIQPTSLYQPTKVAADSTWLRGYVNFINGTASYMSVTLDQADKFVKGSFYLVAEIDSTPSGDVTLLSLENSGVDYYKLTNNLFANRFRAGSNLILTTIDPTVARIFRNYYVGTEMGKQVDDAALVTQNIVHAVASYLTLYVGASINDGTAGRLKLADLLFFKDKKLSESEDLQLRQYLSNYHFGGVALDATFDSGSAWLDNAPL